MTMTNAEALEAAASAIRHGAPLNDGHRELLAQALDAEAALLELFEPFVELINAGIEQAGGGHAALKLVRDPDTNEIRLWGDNTPNAIRLARAIIRTDQETNQ